MRSLFRSNKSTSSIDRFNPSREGSPTHLDPPAAYPPPAQTQQTAPTPLAQQQQQQQQRYSVKPPAASQYDGVADPHDQRRFFEPGQGQGPGQGQEQTIHPAHQLSRSQSQSHRTGAGGDAAYNTAPGRPSVHIIGPSTTKNSENPIYEEQVQPQQQQQQRFPPPSQKSQLQPVAPEKERRKSKRSIFSLHSSSKEPKENSSPTSPQAGQQGKPTRTGSLLKKPQSGPQGPQPLKISGPYAQQPAGNPPFQQRSTEAFYQSQDSLTDSEERAPNEHFYQGTAPFDQAQTQPHAGSNDSPSQAHGGLQYSRQAYQDQTDARSEESAETYLAYQQSQQQQHPEGQEEEDPSGADHHQVRPPSQLSLLSPPSPGTQSGDSRPSSATNQSHQSRFSTQSVTVPQPLSPQQQAHIAMARGDPPPNGLRDQMNQQRDPRLQEANHAPYSGQPDLRSRVPQHTEQGRSTPPPRSREDIGNMDHQTLLQRYEELQSKYSKVKRYYFEKDTQVTQLQNLIANQRLSMSKTMFDDHQYTSRFDRLNGAIRDLAFSIRKDWKGIPPWLTHVVNRDAHTVGTKEMTAVGRACITCWLMDEIFNRFFHPDLEPGLSSQLKLIEKTLRRSGSNQVSSDEQREDMTTKLITWRLATVEGLSEHLASAGAAEYRSKLVHVLTERLTAALKVNLPEATPSGLESGVGMIIELAVSIAQCLPMESRDICIEYFMPGTHINDTYMKTEAPPAPLTNPGVNSGLPPNDDSDDGADGNAEDSQAKLENEIREAAGKASTTGNVGRTESQSGSGKEVKSQKKGGFLGGLVAKRPTPSSGGAGISAKEVAEQQAAENNEGKIRMAVFFAVEVRGRASTGKEGGGSGGDKPVVLIRAPVFGY